MPVAVPASEYDLAAQRPGDHRLPADVLRPLTRIDVRLSLLHIALEWAGIVVAAVVCEHFWSTNAWWLVWAAACVWIGARLHAFGIMAHDGTHGLLSSNKTFNDLLVELTLAWPVMLSLPAYRRMHRLHHRHLNTDVDPDFARNRPDRLATRTNIVQFVQILSGINPEQREMLRFIKGTSHEHDPEPAPLVPRVVVYGVVLGSAVVFGHVDLLAKYWLAPFFSWFLVSMRLKGITEHFAVDSTAPCRASRTLKAGFLWRFLVAPKNVSLHIEHHLYPSVPFYRLPALHTALMALPAYRAHAHITVGYMAFVRECLAFNRRPAPSTTTPIAAILPRRTAA